MYTPRIFVILRDYQIPYEIKRRDKNQLIVKFKIGDEVYIYQRKRKGNGKTSELIVNGRVIANGNSRVVLMRLLEILNNIFYPMKSSPRREDENTMMSFRLTKELRDQVRIFSKKLGFPTDSAFIRWLIYKTVVDYGAIFAQQPENNYGNGVRLYSIRLPEQLYYYLQHFAEQFGMNMADFIRTILNKEISRLLLQAKLNELDGVNHDDSA